MVPPSSRIRPVRVLWSLFPCLASSPPLPFRPGLAAAVPSLSPSFLSLQYLSPPRPPAPPLCPQSHIRTPPFKASVSFIHSRHTRSSGKFFSNCHHITPQYKISSRLQSQINHAPSSGVPPGAEGFRGLLIALSRGLSPPSPATLSLSAFCAPCFPP